MFKLSLLSCKISVLTNKFLNPINNEGFMSYKCNKLIKIGEIMNIK